jgi:hypothetical protein
MPHFYYEFDIDVAGPSIAFTVEGLRATILFGPSDWYVDAIESRISGQPRGPQLWRELSETSPLEKIILERAKTELKLKYRAAAIEDLFLDACIEAGFKSGGSDDYAPPARF